MHTLGHKPCSALLSECILSVLKIAAACQYNFAFHSDRMVSLNEFFLLQRICCCVFEILIISWDLVKSWFWIYCWAWKFFFSYIEGFAALLNGKEIPVRLFSWKLVSRIYDKSINKINEQYFSTKIGKRMWINLLIFLWIFGQVNLVITKNAPMT